MDDEDLDTYYQRHLYKLRDMIQQDVWMNRTDMNCGKVNKESGELLESILSKYLDKIEEW